MNPLNDGVAALDEAAIRAKAWVGDAVLSLFAREWLLEQTGKVDAEAYIRMTSNDFLACLGSPNKIEARIGIVYETQGLQAAFDLLRAHVLPVYQRQEANRAKQR